MISRPRDRLLEDAVRIVNATANAMLGEAAGCRQPMHRRIADSWSVPFAADAIRQALVLIADHELNASTFAARVAASTGAPLAAALLAGLATLAGPRHGGASAAYRQLVAAAGQVGAPAALDKHLASARSVPAFGHPLYPAGDPRAMALLGSFEVDNPRGPCAPR
ncbi:MAG: citrate/2-methylcitrate synthase [Burkholderiaceae bacterium]